MKQHRFWAWGAVICMTAMKQHRFWAWGAVICMIMVMVTGYKRK